MMASLARAELFVLALLCFALMATTAASLVVPPAQRAVCSWEAISRHRVVLLLSFTTAHAGDTTGDQLARQPMSVATGSAVADAAVSLFFAHLVPGKLAAVASKSSEQVSERSTTRSRATAMRGRERYREVLDDGGAARRERG